MTSKDSNNIPYIITNKSSVKQKIGTSLIPNTVLLTAWDIDSASMKYWEHTIKFLLCKGAKNFACMGTYSERLHDEIDELIYQYDDEKGTNNSVNIITTYHADETVEEVIDYCVYGLDIGDKKNCCILAIVNDELTQDQEISFHLKHLKRTVLVHNKQSSC